jgi:ribonuclease HII
VKVKRERENRELERELHGLGFRRICGIDEVGRGALAGPVVAAAVIPDPRYWHEQVDDSKKLSPRRREELFGWIQEHAVAIGVGRAEAAEVDRLNVLRATYLAMQRAVTALSVAPDFLLVDGRDFPFPGRSGRALVGGDRRSFAVACASIIAKVVRDRLLVEWEETFPGYGFSAHKGYGTAAHRKALLELGPTPQHRRTFLKGWDLPLFPAEGAGADF